MKSTALICFALFGAALALPPQAIPRDTCAAYPSFMGSYDRIVGGAAAPSPIPWQVSMRQCQSGGCHYCGGTVLDAKTILTAAHCQVSTNHYIMVGKTNRNEGQNVAIANVINSNWNQQTMDNDIAIVKLATPLTLGGDVQAICLPSAGFNPDVGAECFVSGWGTLQSGAQSLPTQLQYVGVPVVSQASCNNAYSNGITANMICAGLSTGGKDSCQGDSGGPFVCMENGNPVITGVVSFGIGCALADYPGVYARVTQYLPWIQANMEGGSGSPPAPPGPPPATTAAPPSTGCGSPQWQGDNFCDDENNNAECAFDGGDCCGDDVNTQYCSACECLEGTTAAPTTTAAPPPSTEGPGSCESPQWVGDNFCDDGNNNAECGFDGGDCCGDDVNETYCNACECLEQGECEAPVWQGDGFCDDGNNNAGCDFDGGDCCGDDVNTQYCQECECLEAPPSTAAPTTTEEPTACEFPQWVGDNFCDDGNNTPGCDYDGGDCCGDDVNTTYCSLCECMEVCGNPQWEGDNFCDDENNNAGCNFDGGDCCGEAVNFTYCTECACKE